MSAGTRGNIKVNLLLSFRLFLSDSDNSFCGINCVCADYMTDGGGAGVCAQGLDGGGDRPCRRQVRGGVYMQGGGAICRDEGVGGGAGNRIELH